jgi:prevent-host-death family protein
MEVAMPAMTATEAKNRFGQALEMAQAGPVHIQKNGRDVAVLLSAEEYRRLEEAMAKPAVNPAVIKLHEESLNRYRKVYEALAK